MIEVVMPNRELLKKYKDFELFIMQLQIHIENAIEHGLRNRKNSKKIILNIKEEKESLVFEIIDHGAGRHFSKSIGSGGTQQGTVMLSKLHNIYNQRNSCDINSYYEDDLFADEEHTKYGTKVVIEIPLTYQYEFKNFYMRN